MDPSAEKSLFPFVTRLGGGCDCARGLVGLAGGGGLDVKVKFASEADELPPNLTDS
jgi:hypothetical protein